MIASRWSTIFQVLAVSDRQVLMLRFLLLASFFVGGLEVGDGVEGKKIKKADRSISRVKPQVGAVFL